MESTTILAVIEQDLSLIFRLRSLCHDYGLRLSVARSPEEAILYLRGVGVYENRERYPLPRLIMLDTANRTAADLAVLEWVRENASFKNIPVGLLSYEPPHRARVACALDSDSFVIDRESLWEFASIAWAVFFSRNSSIGGFRPSERPR